MRRFIRFLDLVVVVGGFAAVGACVLLSDWQTLLIVAAGWGMRDSLYDLRNPPVLR